MLVLQLFCQQRSTLGPKVMVLMATGGEDVARDKMDVTLEFLGKIMYMSITKSSSQKLI